MSALLQLLVILALASFSTAAVVVPTVAAPPPSVPASSSHSTWLPTGISADRFTNSSIVIIDNFRRVLRIPVPGSSPPPSLATPLPFNSTADLFDVVASIDGQAWVLYQPDGSITSFCLLLVDVDAGVLLTNVSSSAFSPPPPRELSETSMAVDSEGHLFFLLHTDGRLGPVSTVYIIDQQGRFLSSFPSVSPPDLPTLLLLDAADRVWMVEQGGAVNKSNPRDRQARLLLYSRQGDSLQNFTVNTTGMGGDHFYQAAISEAGQLFALQHSRPLVLVWQIHANGSTSRLADLVLHPRAPYTSSTINMALMSLLNSSALLFGQLAVDGIDVLSTSPSTEVQTVLDPRGTLSWPKLVRALPSGNLVIAQTLSSELGLEFPNPYLRELIEFDPRTGAVQAVLRRTDYSPPSWGFTVQSIAVDRAGRILELTNYLTVTVYEERRPAFNFSASPLNRWVAQAVAADPHKDVYYVVGTFAVVGLYSLAWLSSYSSKGQLLSSVNVTLSVPVSEWNDLAVLTDGAARSFVMTGTERGWIGWLVGVSSDGVVTSAVTSTSVPQALDVDRRTGLLYHTARDRAIFAPQVTVSRADGLALKVLTPPAGPHWEGVGLAGVAVDMHGNVYGVCQSWSTVLVWSNMSMGVLEARKTMEGRGRAGSSDQREVAASN